jgi:hypothetical protein
MSTADGMAALRLEMPPRVPRTEYSVEIHHDLLQTVTGIDPRVWEVGEGPGNWEELEGHFAKFDGTNPWHELYRIWDYGFQWSTDIGNEPVGKYHTDMGHAVYTEDGSDFTEIGTCPFPTVDDALAFDPFESLEHRDHATMVKFFSDAYAKNTERCPVGVTMTGIYPTMISGLIAMFGWEMLLEAAGTDPERFGKLANRYGEVMQLYFNALAECDAPVVMVHDDMVWTAGPFMHPSWYREFVFPNFRKYFEPIKASGKILCFTSDGNYTEFLPDLVECGVDCFVFEPMVDMKGFAEKYGQTHAFIGNVDTRVLLSNNKGAIRAEVQRCMDIGKDCPGFFLCVGNHIPPNTPVEAALYYNECYMEMRER